MEHDRFRDFYPSARMRARSQPPMPRNSTNHKSPSHRHDERPIHYERPTYASAEKRRMGEERFDYQESELSFSSDDEYGFHDELYHGEQPVSGAEMTSSRWFYMLRCLDIELFAQNETKRINAKFTYGVRFFGGPQRSQQKSRPCHYRRDCKSISSTYQSQPQSYPSSPFPWTWSVW
jgi:hypothetical protein